MKLSIEKHGSDFRVVDEAGVVYGPVVSSRKEAEQVLADWAAYYEK